MKRTLAFVFLMVCGGVLLGDPSNLGSASRKPAALLEDLVRLTRAGSSNVMVLAYAKAHRLELPPEVSDGDLRWLRDAGVSEAVVRYMTAVDVRASDEGAQVDVASGSYEDTAHPSVAYSNLDSDDDSYGGSYPDRYSASYPDSSYDTNTGYDSFPSYSPGYYPFYPYTSYFFVDRNGFTHRLHGPDPRNGGHRMHDGGQGFRGHRAEVAGPSRDAWRDRGFSGRRGSSRVVGPRGSGRPVFTRGGVGAGFQGPHGRAMGPRGFGPSGAARGSSVSPHTGGSSGRSSHMATGSRGGRGR